MSSTRRTFLSGAGAATAAAAAAQTRPPASNKPNLLYVFADQLGYHHCGYAGDEYARTPNIDRLAAESCNFRQAVSNTPVCAPYRASLLTGKHQSSTGMVINELRLSPEHECFGHALKRGGYRTAYVGKWHLWANELGNHNLTRNGFVPPSPYRLGFDDVWAGYNFNHDYYKAPYFRDTPDRQIWKDYEPDDQTRFTIDFIRGCAQRSEPFAAFLSWGPPHSPWTWQNVAPEWAELYRRADLPVRPNFSTVSDPYADNWAKLPPDYANRVKEEMRVYYAQTANIDWNIGRLVKTLDELGIADNTILVFTSDHGEMFGSHGRQAKYIFYEEASRIPFLIRWPSKIPKKTVTDALLGTPDIMPTLLSMMNLNSPRSTEGVDLSAHAMGKGGSQPEYAFMQGMGTTAAWQDGTEWRALRDHEYTYAIYHRDGSELLFNNFKDPYQLRNLVGERGEAANLRRVRDLSTKWRKEHNDTFEACTWYRDHWTKERNITSTAVGTGQDLAKLDQLVRKYYPEGIPAPTK